MQGTIVSGVIAISQGTVVRTVEVEGTWSSDRVTLQGEDGDRFEAEVHGDELRGIWAMRRGGRSHPWTASRRE